MKNLVKFFAFLFIAAISLTSCRDEEKKDDDTTTVEGVEMENDAEIKVKDDGEKIKMEDSEKEVKIKKDEEGNIEKKKVDMKDEE
ncbi:hypothetical protein [Mesonia maritima]|uniref:Membrane or secreted protein n=1 Tax=Mesonia maritima TaxID=1793873 RepID=A0ABU1K5I1_9FLAO|nr:hypothetical protein [Mesonia maritima]MDR6300875.1 hypothetical protein [Mesonia maritima]